MRESAVNTPTTPWLAIASMNCFCGSVVDVVPRFEPVSLASDRLSEFSHKYVCNEPDTFDSPGYEQRLDSERCGCLRYSELPDI
jgi:hypothetical protein